jgi:hypothetical protein
MRRPTRREPVASRVTSLQREVRRLLHRLAVTPRPVVVVEPVIQPVRVESEMLRAELQEEALTTTRQDQSRAARASFCTRAPIAPAADAPRFTSFTSSSS